MKTVIVIKGFAASAESGIDCGTVFSYDQMMKEAA